MRLVGVAPPAPGRKTRNILGSEFALSPSNKVCNFRFAIPMPAELKHDEAARGPRNGNTNESNRQHYDRGLAKIRSYTP
jgi:hypothetical protein